MANGSLDGPPPEPHSVPVPALARVQRACNSLFQFHPTRPLSLDKIPIWQHGGGRLRITPDHQIGIDRLHWGWDMKLVTGLLAAVVLLAGVSASQAVVRIADDRGGRIGTYVDRYQDLRSSGETVIIDGLCASACTIILGAVAHDKICVTSQANLGFHAAWDFGANGRAITNPEATQMLYSMYPSAVRRWIAQRGGLKSRMIFLRGKQLTSMYRPCYLEAQAFTRRSSSSRRDRDMRPHEVVTPGAGVLARQPY
jgi:hypothetical protein